MTTRSILADPYELLAVAASASADEVWQAYQRALLARAADRAAGGRVIDRGALAQASEDLRQPHKRLAVDMLLGMPEPDDAEIEALIDAHLELPSLASDDVIAILAIAPEPELELASRELAIRPELDDEPIVTLELDP